MCFPSTPLPPPPTTIYFLSESPWLIFSYFWISVPFQAHLYACTLHRCTEGTATRVPSALPKSLHRCTEGTATGVPSALPITATEVHRLFVKPFSVCYRAAQVVAYRVIGSLCPACNLSP